MSQLFQIFPDSPIYEGDTWERIFKENGEFNINVRSVFKLKEVKDDLAIDESKAEIVSDCSASNLMGNQVTASLKGERHSVYSIDIETGILSSGEVNSEMEGTLQSMGREIPISIQTKTSIKSRKTN